MGKKLYEIGELPPIGEVPENMYAWCIRREREGKPEKAMQLEVVKTPIVGSNDVLVMVMAAGVNYNGIWAGLGTPVSVFDVHKQPYHIAGSDASGVVYAVGKDVKHWKIGDEVVIHCNRDNGDDVHCNGGDPMYSPSQKIWGYETPDGSFAQFTCVQSRQLVKKPTHLSWEQAGCYMLTLATAYRMLFGHPPHQLKIGEHALIWGASGGLGVFGLQLARALGAKPIAVISDKSKIDYVQKMGAVGVLDRKDFNCWGQLPDVGDTAYSDYLKEVRKFGKAIREITGGTDVDIVFEHPGMQTIPVSVNVVKTGGMVVICAGTTGYNLTMDARFLWMRQKRVQGSHFAHYKQASEANQLVIDGLIDPAMSECFAFEDIPKAHQKMLDNQHKPGNMAVLVNAPQLGLKSL